MTVLNITRLNSSDSDFDSQLKHLLARDEMDDLEIHQQVLSIINSIRKEGDKTLLNYTNQFDHTQFKKASELNISVKTLKQAWDTLSAEKADALQTAANRIRTYAEEQKMHSWQYTEDDGTVLGQKITALDRVGLYVPGGKAAYPSSVLMNAIPAKVAGVKEVIMVVPTPYGETNQLVLAAAYIVGIDRIFTIGGAQAVAALAYGTKTIPAVDKIVGPGNIYVATAKKMVFGKVGIDMIAGPSEILVICDGKTNPDWIAMDLFSQAEHDEAAQAILISDNAHFLEQVEQSINRLLPKMERKDIIESSLNNRGALIKVETLLQAAEVANTIAPEHLELSVEDPETLNQHIRHAGAIFMGRYTAEALGDYCAGPNHVLPTSSTARYSSPLGVYDFQKRSSLINCSEIGADTLGKTASILARGEGLIAHARSAEYRIK
ncbi:MAG: histidinol dehydrogenase [Methylococcales symbiont of Iophon sp. n. MRB-2018]|nr:MAG: histidinol dehydrogenase [Methylococcales symbiont of Iophon sp. n. MRB-2018]KAF3980163.1 MAG: histidinol dehydrogenase [Methylococcales symbiont of Iophon sp. n. MRB-2018]